jgi:hypothetical protein
MEMKMIGKAMIVAAGMLISMPVMAEEWDRQRKQLLETGHANDTLQT